MRNKVFLLVILGTVALISGFYFINRMVRVISSLPMARMAFPTVPTTNHWAKILDLIRGFAVTGMPTRYFLTLESIELVVNRNAKERCEI